MLTEAYKAEYETTPITLAALLEKYDLTKEDIPGHETWIPFLKVEKPIVKKKVTPKQKKVDTILETIATKAQQPTQPTQPTQLQEVLPPVDIKPTQEVLPPVDTKPTPDITQNTSASQEQLTKIANFKALALDHCITFMSKDAQFAEVKEFKDIVSIVDSLEKSYQKVDPDAGKPTINILIQNLMQNFKDDV